MIVERLQDGFLTCHINDNFANDRMEILLLKNKNVLSRWSYSSIYWSKRLDGKNYFQIPIESIDQGISIIDGSLELRLLNDGFDEAFKIFSPLKETLKIRSLDERVLGSTFRLLPPERKRILRRAIEYGTKPLTGSKIDRKQVCIITYANDSGGWFDVFYKHYVCQLGDANFIYVITPKPESFKDINLGGLIGLTDFPFDNFARVQLISGLASGLRAYYDWVITTDVDELIFVDSGDSIGKKTICERLGDGCLPDINFSLGLDVIQASRESDFDHSRPLLEQRRYVVPNSGMCKPHIARGIVNLDIGLHYCQVPPRIEAPGNGFLMLHLKYACRSTRKDVTRIVENTNYASITTRTYAYSSVGLRVSHPGLKLSNTDMAIPLWQWDRRNYERRIM